MINLYLSDINWKPSGYVPLSDKHCLVWHSLLPLVYALYDPEHIEHVGRSLGGEGVLFTFPQQDKAFKTTTKNQFKSPGLCKPCTFRPQTNPIQNAHNIKTIHPYVYHGYRYNTLCTPQNFAIKLAQPSHDNLKRPRYRLLRWELTVRWQVLSKHTFSGCATEYVEGDGHKD